MQCLSATLQLLSWYSWLQPCDKAAMLRVNTIEYFVEEFT